MGLKVINPLIKSVAKKAPKVLQKAEVQVLFKPPCKQAAQKGISRLKTKFFTRAEILEMKPSEFKRILESRTDIPEAIRKGIPTPEKLNLFDEVVQLEAVQKMEPAAKEEFLKKLFSQFNLKTNEASAQLEVIPDLIKKGYDPQTLAELRICEHNKDIVETVLKRTDLPEKYAMERGGWKTPNVMKNVYQHTFSEQRRVVDAQIDAYFEQYLPKDM